MKNITNVRKIKKQNKGITLIALVITIIVLLILAGISLATLTGNNGILTKADTSQEETRGATVEEIKNLWKTEQTADKHTGKNETQTLEKLLDHLEEEKLITPEERTTIENDGEIVIGSKTIVFEKLNAIDKVGNKVNANKDDEGNLDYEKLKEDLENIKNIQGVPSDLTEEKFPLVVKVDDTLIQINPDGSVEEVTELDLFPFLENSDITLSEAGIDFSSSGCEYTTVQLGSIGGGHSTSTGNWSWQSCLTDLSWIDKASSVTLKTHFYVSEGPYGSSYGSATIVKKDGTSESVQTTLIRGYVTGVRWIHWTSSNKRLSS